MLYNPTNIHTEGYGLKNKSWGIGVITSLGAFLTGPIPPFSDNYVIAYYPRQTVFVRKERTQEILNIPPNTMLGIKQLNAILYKPLKHTETVTMKLAKTVPIDADILIEEIELGIFKVFVYMLDSKQTFQPYNGWTYLQ